jgi:hypothetical protein
MAEKPTKVRIVHKRGPEYRVIAANGAWGGLTANGFIHIDLYLERPAPPPPSAQELLHETGTLGEERPEDPVSVPVIEREAQVGVILSPQGAIVLARWLAEQVRDLRDAMTQSAGGETSGTLEGEGQSDDLH